MAHAMTEPAPRTSAAKLAACDDAELLRRIAQKDRVAFDELYARYKDRVYSLIYAIVHDANDAQDALQEAFLRIWKGAGSVKHFEQIPSWILRVAAREGLRIHRLRGRKKNRMLSLDEDQGGADAGKPQHEAPAPPPPGEAVLALREQVLRLDASQQRLVALYFGGKLSQAEIAEALELTQQAVSARIQKITERLREGLQRAGFAAAAPMLAPEFLREALVTVRTAPASAGASAAAHVARESRRVAGMMGSGTVPAAIAAVLLLAAGATAWIYLTPASPNAPPAPASHISPSQNELPAASGAAEAPPAGNGVLRRWTFDTPEDTGGLTVIVGAWHHVAGGKGGGYMVSDTKDVQVRIDLPVEKLPVEVSFDANTEVKPSAEKLVYMTVAWDRSNGIAFFHNAGTPSQKGDIVRAFVADRTIELHLGPNRSKMLATERTGPEARLVLVLEGNSTAIDNLQVRRITPADVPDASVFLNALDALPPEARTTFDQEFELPGVPSPQPGKKITVSFFPPSKVK